MQRVLTIFAFSERPNPNTRIPRNSYAEPVRFPPASVSARPPLPPPAHLSFPSHTGPTFCSSLKASSPFHLLSRLPPRLWPLWLLFRLTFSSRPCHRRRPPGLIDKLEAKAVPNPPSPLPSAEGWEIAVEKSEQLAWVGFASHRGATKSLNVGEEPGLICPRLPRAEREKVYPVFLSTREKL